MVGERVGQEKIQKVKNGDFYEKWREGDLAKIREGRERVAGKK